MAVTSLVKVGGKQYLVHPGSTLVVDRFNAAVGDAVTFDDLLGGKSVKATIVSHHLGPKVMTRRFRNKTRYTRTIGHRQPKTVLAFSSSLAHNKQ